MVGRRRLRRPYRGRFHNRGRQRRDMASLLLSFALPLCLFKFIYFSWGKTDIGEGEGAEEGEELPPTENNGSRSRASHPPPDGAELS
ncbi:hypothetical protein CRG98_024163 [Punica granatum]|uniref:Uncharacterized protein n=1 Tax=Punica granatum TaxID=22663 RepID=A0A2I0JHQ3_PUNGR|nr:hypothetical protein CRG98_024163 [Punica granatum]